MDKHKKDAFCIKIDYEKDSNPATIFQSMSELVRTFQDFDVEFAKTISVEIEPKLVLEQIEGSSIKAWLTSKLSDIKDESIKNLDWKSIVGELLVKAKYWLMERLKENKPIDKQEIDNIQKKLHKLSQDAGIKHIPSYELMPQKTIVKTYLETERSISALPYNDKVQFICEYGELVFGRIPHISEEMINSLLVAKTDVSESDVCLKIKKPDYLGDSKWLFYLDSHPIEVKIEDMDWLKDFRSRKFILRPGDSLQVRLKTEIGFDNEGVQLPPRYFILKINSIIEGTDKQNNPELFD